ncbi:MAG: DUF1365 domain-containing protein [Pontibacterium sp.]
MALLNSGLYFGQVLHHRMHPTKHRFVYKVFSACLDLDELVPLNKLKLFSVNRFNVFSFHEKDHCNGQGDLAAHIRGLLIDKGFEHATAQIKLLCYPRVLGYVFNPLSVYFCYSKQNKLEVILYEVTNTFGGRHIYLLPAQKTEAITRHRCSKSFFVSPFMPMDTDYHFRILPPANKVSVAIRQVQQANNQPILHALFSGEHQPLNDKTLLNAFLKYPLMTIKVIAGIHWEALHLWRKKVGLLKNNTQKQHSISWVDSKGDLRYESL